LTTKSLQAKYSFACTYGPKNALFPPALTEEAAATTGSLGPNWDCPLTRAKMSSLLVDIPGYHGAVRLLASGLPSEGWGQKPPMAAFNFGPSPPFGDAKTHVCRAWVATLLLPNARGPHPHESTGTEVRFRFRQPRLPLHYQSVNESSV
jgi:hypothetical protein